MNAISSSLCCGVPIIRQAWTIRFHALTGNTFAEKKGHYFYDSEDGS